ncbi:MAG: hypothetical protein WKF77_26965 [Planctomycetaceae bacterium]
MFLLARCSRSLLPLIALLSAIPHSALVAQDAAASSEKSGVQFDLASLSSAPEVFPVDNLQVEGVKAIYYAGQTCKGKPTRILATIMEHGIRDAEAWATFSSEVPIVNAKPCFTRSTGKWQDREWESLPAKIDATASRVIANVPADATVFYLNLFDNRQCAVSTPHTIRP